MSDRALAAATARARKQHGKVGTLPGDLIRLGKATGPRTDAKEGGPGEFNDFLKIIRRIILFQNLLYSKYNHLKLNLKRFLAIQYIQTLFHKLFLNLN